MRIKQRLACCALAMLLALAAGCAPKAPLPGTLSVHSYSTSLGSADSESLDVTELTYKIDLTNDEAYTVQIRSIRLVLGDAAQKRLIGENPPQEWSKTLRPGETAAVEGKLTFDTKGMTKEQIVQLEPFLADIVVVREQTIPLTPQ